MKNLTQSIKKKQTGFTLLELVVVVAVMGLISTMAMDVYTDKSNQTRFELTEKRIEEIRYAIIGNDSRELNGQTTISGYIADTGKVPTEIRQLILKKYCEDDALYFTKDHCENAGEVWVNQANWKGPYIKTFSSKKVERLIGGVNVISNIPVFRDGWGRSSGDLDTDMKNYGWEFDNNSGDITLQSLGLDRKVSSSSVNVFEDDYPANGINLITANQYKGSSNPLEVTITNNSGSTKGICLMWNGIVSNNSGSQTINDGDEYIQTISASQMGFIGFILDKNTDCDVSDGLKTTLSKTHAVVHYSITNPTFKITLN